MSGDGPSNKGAEKTPEVRENPKSAGVAEAVRDQTTPTKGANNELWKPDAGPRIETAHMTELGATPSDPNITMAANKPIYDKAMGAVIPAPPPDATRETNDRPPGTAAPTDAPQKQGDKVEALLTGNPKLATEVTAMRENIAKMDPKAREIASKGLDDFLARGTDGPHSASAPKLDAGKMTDALHNLNHAMGTDAKHLSSLMGSESAPSGFQKSEREMNRDITVAQALRNLGDSAGIHQTGHQTCLLDGKLGDEARKSPDAYTKVLDQAMTTGTASVGGHNIKLNDSFMRPDAAAWNSTGGRDGTGMSADVRMLTGVYANALTQPKGLEFKMSADGAGARGPNDTGDRLTDMRTGQALKFGPDGDMTFKGNGRYIDSPNVGLEDSARLNRMMGDGGIVASNTRWGEPKPEDKANFRNIESVDDLKRALADGRGSMQAGLNAHILFGNDKVGANGPEGGGGHVTGITAMKDGPDGKPMFYVQDTNHGTSGWYSGDHIVAAIKNDHSWGNKVAPGEDAPILTGRSGNQAAAMEGPVQPAAPAGQGTPYERPGASGGTERPFVVTPGSASGGFTPVDTVANPHGMVDNPQQKDDVIKNSTKESDAERAARDAETEKQRAAMWQSLMKQEKERQDEEERQRRKQNGQP